MTAEGDATRPGTPQTIKMGRPKHKCTEAIESHETSSATATVRRKTKVVPKITIAKTLVGGRGICGSISIRQWPRDDPIPPPEPMAQYIAQTSEPSVQCFIYQQPRHYVTQWPWCDKGKAPEVNMITAKVQQVTTRSQAKASEWEVQDEIRNATNVLACLIISLSASSTTIQEATNVFLYPRDSTISWLLPNCKIAAKL